MRSLTYKMRSTNGASIIVALLFMLVCTCVGASVLALAYANTNCLQSDQRDNKEYLTLSSAAELVRDQFEIDNPKLIVSEDTNETVNYNVSPASCGPFVHILLSEGVQNAYASQDWSTNFTVKAEDFDDVTVAMSIDSGYNVKCVLTTESANYALLVSFVGNKTTRESTVGGVTTKTTNVTWGDGVISKGRSS